MTNAPILWHVSLLEQLSNSGNNQFTGLERKSLFGLNLPVISLQSLLFSSSLSKSFQHTVRAVITGYHWPGTLSACASRLSHRNVYFWCEVLDKISPLSAAIFSDTRSRDPAPPLGATSHFSSVTRVPLSGLPPAFSSAFWRCRFALDILTFAGVSLFIMGGHTNAGLNLGQRYRRWLRFKSTLARCAIITVVSIPSVECLSSSEITTSPRHAITALMGVVICADHWSFIYFKNNRIYKSNSEWKTTQKIAVFQPCLWTASLNYCCYTSLYQRKE